MGIVKDILSEERQRLLSLKRRYEKQLAELPKGSISNKKRGNREYCYLAYRDGKKVCFEYIGAVDSEAARNMENQVRRRRAIVEKLKQVAENVKEVERGLRGSR